MLTDRYSTEMLTNSFLPRDQWSPVPRASDRKAWEEKLRRSPGREQRDYIVKDAEPLSNFAWPPIPATLFMEFEKNGNRIRFEAPYMKRRKNLATLVLAECFEYKGRFLDAIINGTWAITEEATWALSAHAFRRQTGDSSKDPLPWSGEETLALFSLETALLLAETAYLLEEELAAETPAVLERIRTQLFSRVIETFENNPDDARYPDSERLKFQWLDGHNNWTPWCCRTLLGTAMHLLEDNRRLAGIAFRLMKAADRFIDQYGPDGGCDEGASYWNHAAGELLMFLELLRDRTAGKVDIYDQPILREMALYITRVHLGNSWFANFADASAHLKVRREAVWRFGERTEAEQLKALVLYQIKGEDRTPRPPLQRSTLSNMLRQIFWIPEELPDIPLTHEKKVWMPDIQVMVTRESAEDARGLVCAAKGGHNKESHNHNDLGHFILFNEGTPLVIDNGSSQYTRQTFNEERYTLWPYRSLSHNVPIINGYEQQPGPEFRTTQADLTETPTACTLTLELTRAYPEAAGIHRLERTITHCVTESSEVRVRDILTRQSGPCEIALHLLTPEQTEKTDARTLVIGSGRKGLELSAAEKDTGISLEKIQPGDSRLNPVWKNGLTIIRICRSAPSESLELNLVFRKKISEKECV